MIDLGPGRTPPTDYDNGGHGGYYTGQGADLKAHLAYFDVRTQASFVWDGKSPMIEVHLGGYGEDVDHEIPSIARAGDVTWPAASFFVVWQGFEERCQKHAATLPTYGSQAF